MGENKFRGPNPNPQLHLFDDNNIKDKNRKNQVGQPIVPKIEKSGSNEKTEDFLLKKANIISKYKIGSEAVNNLIYKIEESNEDDDASGWYIRNEKLIDWHKRMESLYDDKDEEYEYPWQKLNNK